MPSKLCAILPAIEKSVYANPSGLRHWSILKKRTLILSTAICGLLTSVIYAFGDIARPKVSSSPGEGKIVFHTSLLVTSDSKASEARLQISQETLKRIREATADASVNESLTQRIVHSSTRTMMAGGVMFLAVSFAGVWLARSSQRPGPKAGPAGLLAFLLGAGAI